MVYFTNAFGGAADVRRRLIGSLSYLGKVNQEADAKRRKQVRRLARRATEERSGPQGTETTGEGGQAQAPRRRERDEAGRDEAARARGADGLTRRQT